jgi:hypothetical protein
MMRSMMTTLLLLAALGCGNDTTGDAGDGDGGGEGHGNRDGGDGDGDGNGDDDVTYPDFIPGNCLGKQCPAGECGRVNLEPCWESYIEPFDADYSRYCVAGPGASYCVGSQGVGPGSPPSDTYCINCVDGEPTFEHCEDGSVTWDNDDAQAHCVNPA